MCDFVCSHVLVLPSLLASPCRFTVRKPRTAAESRPLAILMGSHVEILPSLQLSPCRSTLQEIGPYTPFAISAAFTVQIHASKIWHQRRRNRVFRSTVQIHASGIWHPRQIGESQTYFRVSRFHFADPRFRTLAQGGVERPGIIHSHPL